MAASLIAVADVSGQPLPEFIKEPLIEAVYSRRSSLKARSGFPSVCGWATDERISLIPRLEQKAESR